jgi:hypothetical protein
MKKLLAVFVLCACLAACAPAPAAAPTLTPAPTRQGYRDFPSTMEGNGIAVAPGQYKTPSWYGVPLAFEFSDENWKVITLERSELLAFVQGENEKGYATRWLVFLPVYDDEAKALENEMLEAPGFTFLAGPEQRAIGDHTGTLMVLQAQPNADFAETDEYVAGVRELTVLQAHAGNWQWLTSTPEAMVELITFEVGERTMSVYIEAPAEEFEAFVEEAQALMQAVKPLQ